MGIPVENGFNPDITKQEVEVIFSVKIRKIEHPELTFNGIPVAREDSTKQPGLHLDNRLNFSKHIKEAVLKASKGVTLLKYLSNFVDRKVLDMCYKLYVRLHIIYYRDVIYHMCYKLYVRLHIIYYRDVIYHMCYKLYVRLHIIYYRDVIYHMCYKLYVRLHIIYYRDVIYHMCYKLYVRLHIIYYRDVIYHMCYKLYVRLHIIYYRDVIYHMCYKLYVRLHIIYYRDVIYHMCYKLYVRLHIIYYRDVIYHMCYKLYVRLHIIYYRDVIYHMCYKLYVRLHIIYYRDVIYHMQRADLMKLAEQVQYKAGLIVSGCWQGTNRDKLYEELGCEASSDQRWFHRLTLFYKISNGLTPSYLSDHIVTRSETSISLHRRHVIAPLSRTARYQNSFFPYCIAKWKDQDDSAKNLPSHSSFKKNILKFVGPPGHSFYGISDKFSIKLLTKIRVEFSDLRDHRFNHNFNYVRPVCNCGKENETSIHFFSMLAAFQHTKTNPP